MTLTIIIIVWVALGIHSCWYFKECYTLHYDLTENQYPELIVCFFLPLITHFATYVSYDKKNKPKILVKKKDDA